LVNAKRPGRALESRRLTCQNGPMAREVPGIELSFSEVVVADWPRALRWYSGVLGLHPTVEDAANGFALLDAGPCRLALRGAIGPPGRLLT
jgi:hypothetical protein